MVSGVPDEVTRFDRCGAFLSLHRLRCDRLKNWHFIKMPEVKSVKAAKPVWLVTIIFEPTPPSTPSPPFFQPVEKSVCATGFFGVTVFWKLATERTISCSSNCHFVSYISYLSKPKRSCMPARYWFGFKATVIYQSERRLVIFHLKRINLAVSATVNH